MRPKTRYAQSGDLSIAYQVVGDGPRDIVYVPGWVSNHDYAWTLPRLAHVFDRLGAFGRLIMFDKRGTGLSDRNVGYPTLEERMEDLDAVMAAAGSERAVLMGTSEGGNLCMLYAATYPEKTAALVLYGSFAKGLWSDDYPWAKTREQTEEELEQIARDWGGPFDLSNAAPSLAGDEATSEWLAAYLRNSAAPQDAISLWRWNTEIDVRNILPAIQVPTLVICRTGDRWVKRQDGQYLADHIPGATFVELPGDDHVIWAGDSDRTLDEIEAFLTGVRPRPSSERVLLTVLFTDIVGSTSLASRLGDREWNALMQRHDEAVRSELRQHGGTEIKMTGDGLLATFQGPTRAIQCGGAIRDRLRTLGLTIRAAAHTGECEMRGNDVGGLCVNIAARILGEASPDEFLVSRTIRDIVVGSGTILVEKGEATLRDVPGTWQLHAVQTIPRY